MFHIACNTIKQMKGLQTSTMITENVKDNTLDSSDDEGVDKGAQSKNEILKKNKKCYCMKLQEPMNYLPKPFTWPN